MYVKIARHTIKAQSAGALLAVAKVHLSNVVDYKETYHYTAGGQLPHTPADTQMGAAGSPPAAPGRPPHALD